MSGQTSGSAGGYGQAGGYGGQSFNQPAGSGMQRGISQMPQYNGGYKPPMQGGPQGISQPYQPQPGTDANNGGGGVGMTAPDMSGGGMSMNQPPPGWVVDPNRQGGVRPWDQQYQALLGNRAPLDPTHGGPFYMPGPQTAPAPDIRPGGFQPSPVTSPIGTVPGGPQRPGPITNSPFGMGYQNNNWNTR
jgi:hypothetical protein